MTRPSPHTCAVGANRIALLHTVGAIVIAERFDRTLLVGEIMRVGAFNVTIAPVGTRRRVRILTSRIRKVSLMNGLAHAIYAHICERQRAGERFTAQDVGLPKTNGPPKKRSGE